MARVPASDVVTLDGQSVATVNGAEVAISVDGDSVMVDDANVIAVDVELMPEFERAAYADPESVVDELRRARRLFRERGWRMVDITGKAVEENAARILDAYQALGRRPAASP